MNTLVSVHFLWNFAYIYKIGNVASNLNLSGKTLKNK